MKSNQVEEYVPRRLQPKGFLTDNLLQAGIFTTWEGMDTIWETPLAA